MCYTQAAYSMSAPQDLIIKSLGIEGMHDLAIPAVSGLQLFLMELQHCFVSILSFCESILAFVSLLDRSVFAETSRHRRKVR